MTGITEITRDYGDNVSIVRITTTDTLSTASAANYITSQKANIETANQGDFEWLASDMTLVYASNGWMFASITSDFTSLTPMVFSTNVVGTPVVVGDFAVFASTGGNLKDSGFLPSDATKTVVVMASAAVTTNALAVFADTAGTLKNASTTATLGQALSVTGNLTSSATLQGVNLKYGATPVAQVDPASCTITAAAGAANTATVTVQLKDGSGTNMARSIGFKVYASSAADGLTLASAASTGFSVASGGLSLANGAAVTTQINAMSSATGGCVLSLLDTGKQTSYLVLVLPNGNKISAQLSAGSYG
jgi:hypothetical protein